MTHGTPEHATPGPPAQPPPLRGLLLIDKPLGPTSMATCARVRAALRRGGAAKRVKVGHGGTLDPLATGLLVVLCGKATTLCERVMQGEKRYLARVDLSAFTSTDDREGERREVEIDAVPTKADVETAAASMVGEVLQRPPAFSAMKVNGRRAYALARRGEHVQLEPRPVFIRSIRVLEYQWPHADVEVVSGKGVYIRSIARDLGLVLRTGGTLASLRRTAIGPFTVDEATALDQLPRVLTQEHLQPVDRWLGA